MPTSLAYIPEQKHTGRRGEGWYATRAGTSSPGTIAAGRRQRRLAGLGPLFPDRPAGGVFPQRIAATSTWSGSTTAISPAAWPRRRKDCAYAYVLDDGREYPDPASRWQPKGVHRPSAVFFPETFAWSDAAWRGVARKRWRSTSFTSATFTPEGTLDAIIPRLPQLADLGVTAIELMPVAQFPGERNWGYDGVHPYAVQNSYGGPRALQRLVDAAHRRGLAVILDVVYNHLGPEGNYLGQFGPYFTDRYHTPWGNAINFDGPESDAVRAFFIHNARMWVRDFHVDGLRLDAVQTIYDFGVRHILADIQEAVQEEAARAGRTVHVIAESNQNDVRLVSRAVAAGMGWTACGRTTSTTASTPCSPGSGRLLHGLRSARPSGEGDPRRLRLRRLLQPASPPSLRQPGGQDGSFALRRAIRN